MIYFETWSSIQPCVSFWALEFCSCLFLAEHAQHQFSSLPKAIICVSCVRSFLLVDGLGFSLSLSLSLFSPFPEFEMPLPSLLLGPLPMPSMYNQCENSEPQEVRIIKLLRIVHLRR